MRLTGVGWAATAVALLTAASACRPPVDRAFVLRGLNVVDVESGDVLVDGSIRIEGGRIAAVGARSEVPTASARVVDSAGLWAIPGLFDLHFHSYGERALLELAVTQGVTTVREMGSVLETSLALRAAIEAGSWIGPRLYTSGPMLESPRAMASARQRAGSDAAAIEDLETKHVEVATPADAERIVDDLARRGADFIKMRSYAEEATYRALIEAAGRHGLKLVGHPPWDLDPLVAAEAGQHTFEHGFYPYPLSDLEPERREALFAALRAHDVTLVPTLVAWESRTIPPDRLAAVVGDRAGRIDPRRRYLPESLMAHWRQDLAERGDGGGESEWAEAVATAASDIGEMHRAGVRVAAGTDAASFMVFPGFSSHDELELLAGRAGFSPIEALRAATVRAAEVLGVQGEVGTLRAGLAADLLLLRADPRAEIGHTRAIEAMVVRGRFLSRQELDGLLEEIRAARGEGPPQAPVPN